MCEAGAAAGVVGARQVVLQVGERCVPLERIRAPDRVHDAVAVRENEPALAPDGPLDRGDGGPRIVFALDERLERARPAVTRGVGEETPAPLDVDRKRVLLLVRPQQEQSERESQGDQPRGGQQEEASGPPRRAARSGLLLYLIWNFACPVEVLPLMSVASHLNVVVVLTTKDWPGSRGPVESQSVDVEVGFDPSVV